MQRSRSLGEMPGNHAPHRWEKFALKKTCRVRATAARVAQEQVRRMDFQRGGNFQNQLERGRRLARLNPADIPLGAVAHRRQRGLRVALLLAVINQVPDKIRLIRIHALSVTEQSDNKV